MLFNIPLYIWNRAKRGIIIIRDRAKRGIIIIRDNMNSYIELDLIDETMFDDIPELFITLEEAGLEDKSFDTVSAAQSEYYKDEY